MGAIIAILTSVGALIFWLSRAASNAHHITDAANELANLPRKRRFMKAADKRGLDLIDDPREAATVLMVATARLRGDGRVSDGERAKILSQLTDTMALEAEAAEGLVDNVRWLTRDFKQPGTVMQPVIDMLRKSLTQEEAEDLAHMMTEVSLADGLPKSDQIIFIKKFREYMGLNIGA